MGNKNACMWLRCENAIWSLWRAVINQSEVRSAPLQVPSSTQLDWASQRGWVAGMAIALGTREVSLPAVVYRNYFLSASINGGLCVIKYSWRTPIVFNGAQLRPKRIVKHLTNNSITRENNIEFLCEKLTTKPHLYPKDVHLQKSRKLSLPLQLLK